MISNESFSPGFQQHHFKSTNVPGNLVTVVRMQLLPSPDDDEAQSAWIEELLQMVSKEHGGTYEIGDFFKAGSFDSGTNLIIYLKEARDVKPVVTGKTLGLEQREGAGGEEPSAPDDEGAEGPA